MSVGGFESIDKATQLWIKGAGFTIPKLIHNDHLMRVSSYTLGIFRLAPQDYHRFHSPVDGVIESIKHIDGEYYTVNPMAIRSELDVFGKMSGPLLQSKQKILEIYTLLLLVL